MDAYYSSKDICKKLAIGRSTINKWQDTKAFPRPELIIGGQCNRWNADEVDAWIDQFRDASQEAVDQ